MTTAPSQRPTAFQKYSPWLLPLLLLTVAYGLLGLTLTESLTHEMIMQRCVLVDPKMARIWSVGNIEIGVAYLGVFLGMIAYFVRIFGQNRSHLTDLAIACVYLLGSFLIDYFCVQHFKPFVALLVGDAIIMTFTVLVSRQLWFQRLLGVFVPIIFLTCGIGHFLEGLSYWQLTYPFNVPWTMVTADIGFAVLVNSARFPAFIRGQDVVEELQEAKHSASELDTQLMLVTQSREALKHSEERFRTAVLTVGDILWTNNAAGEMVGEQPGWGAFTGQTEAEYKGYGWAEAVHPQDAQPTIDAWQEAVAEKKMFIFEHRVRRHDGVWRLFSIRSAMVLNEDGTIREWVGVHTDITERRESEARIMTLNERLRRAMTETHHRVKNNLQVVSAIAEMQMETDSPTVPITALERIALHVRTLAQLHEILTLKIKDTGEYDTLDTQDTLNKLLPLLQESMEGRTLRYEIAPLTLSVEKTVSLSQLISELVSNAVKHGAGKIGVTLEHNGEDVCLTVRDQGQGFPPHFNPRNTGNTGLDLIDSLVALDLGGTCEFTNLPEGGASVIVHFPLKDTA